MSKSGLEFAFLNYWLMLTDLPEPTHDYCFVRDVVGDGPGIRKRLRDAGLKDWRFDWAWPDQRVAVEMEGGIWTQGAHVRGKHFESDAYKYNFAQSQGWSLYRFTVGMLDRDPVGCINQVQAEFEKAQAMSPPDVVGEAGGMLIKGAEPVLFTDPLRFVKEENCEQNQD